jgi:hypothetical protein
MSREIPSEPDDTFTIRGFPILIVERDAVPDLIGVWADRDQGVIYATTDATIEHLVLALGLMRWSGPDPFAGGGVSREARAPYLNLRSASNAQLTWSHILFSIVVASVSKSLRVMISSARNESSGNEGLV